MTRFPRRLAVRAIAELEIYDAHTFITNLCRLLLRTAVCTYVVSVEVYAVNSARWSGITKMSSFSWRKL